jgi:hypothetical protein
VLVNGTTVASKAFDPLVQWGYDNLTPRQFEVDWDAETGMTVRLDGASTDRHLLLGRARSLP